MSTERMEALKQFIQQRPQDPFPRYALALEFKSAGDLAASADAFRDLATNLPEYVPTYLQMAMVLQQLERIDEAKDTLTKGIVQAGRAGNAHAKSEMEGLLGSLQ